jgi:hypothetical protein
MPSLGLLLLLLLLRLVDGKLAHLAGRSNERASNAASAALLIASEHRGALDGHAIESALPQSPLFAVTGRHSGWFRPGETCSRRSMNTAPRAALLSSTAIAVGLQSTNSLRYFLLPRDNGWRMASSVMLLLLHLLLLLLLQLPLLLLLLLLRTYQLGLSIIIGVMLASAFGSSGRRPSVRVADDADGLLTNPVHLSHSVVVGQERNSAESRPPVLRRLLRPEVLGAR